VESGSSFSVVCCKTAELDLFPTIFRLTEHFILLLIPFSAGAGRSRIP
jgi:hypothetical protein